MNIADFRFVTEIITEIYIVKPVSDEMMVTMKNV